MADTGITRIDNLMMRTPGVAPIATGDQDKFALFGDHWPGDDAGGAGAKAIEVTGWLSLIHI